MRMNLLGAAALGLMVAACGTDPTERTTGGAAAGAATGAGIGALGGPVGALAGAAIGGGAGAVTGAVTEPEDVNLGRPVWSDPEVRLPGRDDEPVRRTGGARGSAETRDIQRALSQRGYDVGPVDGIWGPRTRAAVEEFQRSNNMQVTGRADSQLRQALNVTDTRTGSQSDDRNRAYMGGGMVPGQQDGGRSGQGMGTQGTGSDLGRGNTVTGGGRPNPSGPAGGGVPAPSNNPMNDPVGGAGQATVPGMNQNR